MATNGAAAVESGGAANGNNNLSKDEVAWFFVEQYYTTLSKTPEKLHLFYGKRSQFVYGQEAQVANVSVGRQAIQERIQSLGFQDSQTKVRVSNVDSQSSFDSIVIQVIGETSSKAGDEPKKFVQTFVLAQQPSGYFVLNDILRYIDDESEEEQGEAAEPEAAAEEPAAAPVEAAAEPEVASKPESVPEVAAPIISLDPGVVDEKLQEVTASTKDASTNGDETQDEAASVDDASQKGAAAAETLLDPEATVRELEEEDTKLPEKPTDPSPTPVTSRDAPRPAPAQTPAQAPTPAQPSKPMTWASRLAASAGPPKPVVPLPQTKTATQPAAPRPAAQAAAVTMPAPPVQAPAAEAAGATAAPAADAAAGGDSAEWKTAGSDSKRHNRPQSISAPPPEKDGVLGYIKYVTEKVQHEDLKAALAKYGEIVYFDINRSKNCAFVEFAAPAGYQAAAAANPHEVNGESIVVEPRRPKAGAYGGANYSTGRGNIPSRGGRGGYESPRTGSQSGRGSFGGQNRGRGAPRGRGGSQANNA